LRLEAVFRLVPATQKGSEWDSCKWEGDMKAITRSNTGTFVLGIALVLCSFANAQEAKQPDLQQLRSYNVSRESFLLGTVVKFDSASSTLPMGAHVVLQTSSGQIDVHLGDAKVLRASHFELNPGDSVRIVGEPMALGDNTYFAARIVQKGAQAVAVRNIRGSLTTPASLMTPAQKEALRGVR
jgi:hypothetical protein